MSAAFVAPKSCFDTSAGLRAVEVHRPQFTEWLITANRLPGESAESMFARLADAVIASGSHIAAQQVFGLGDNGSEGQSCLRDLMNGQEWPVTWLDEGCDRPGGPAGTWVRAITGTAISHIRSDGTVIGSVYEDSYGTYCELGGLHCDDRSLSNAEQARQVLQIMSAALAHANMAFAHVLRTWFFNHKITRWYREFNRERTSFFDAQRVWDGLLPASTGVGGSNSAGTALSAGLLAMKPKGTQVGATIVNSPLQCPAPQYGSSFSRAVELSMPGYRWLTISGTASIDPVGNTLHIDDTAQQIDLTLQVVHAILSSRGMDWCDISRSVAYFRDGAEASMLNERLARAGISPFPVIPCRMDICRDDLLFELEADAFSVV